MGLIPQCMHNKLKMYVYIAKFTDRARIFVWYGFITNKMLD